MRLRTRRTWQLPPRRPAGIGHNQGPPLDSWSATHWRRAKKTAWGRAPAEVVCRRAKRAQELGLSYRDYTAVILDRGTHPEALVFMFAGTLASGLDTPLRPMSGVIAKLSGLTACRVYVVAPDAAAPLVEELSALCDGKVDGCLSALSADGFRAALADQGVSPSAAIMIGASEAEEALALAAGLGGFVWAGDYFGSSSFSAT